jgi:hypothetical protein
MSLSSSHPTRDQAIDAVRALVSHWSCDLPDERLDSIAGVFMRFSLGVVAACVHLDGIARTKIPNLRTGKLEPRRFVPSDGEIFEWCSEHRADLHEIVKAAEVVDRSIQSSSIAPSRPPPCPKDVAHVWRRVDEIKERCNRILGIPTADERRECAERILEATREGR